MRGLANPTAISHTYEGPIEGKSMISNIDFQELKKRKARSDWKNKSFYWILRFWTIEALEKGLANLHTTDKSEKTIAGTRLPEPWGQNTASIAWFGEHQERGCRRQRKDFCEKGPQTPVRLTKVKKVVVTLERESSDLRICVRHHCLRGVRQSRRMAWE